MPPRLLAPSVSTFPAVHCPLSPLPTAFLACFALSIHEFRLSITSLRLLSASVPCSSLMRGSFVCPSSCSSSCSISTTTTIKLPLFLSLLSLLLLVLPPHTYLTLPYLTSHHRSSSEHSKSECPLHLSYGPRSRNIHMYYVTLPLLYQIHNASCESQSLSLSLCRTR